MKNYQKPYITKISPKYLSSDHLLKMGISLIDKCNNDIKDTIKSIETTLNNCDGMDKLDKLNLLSVH